MYDAARNGFSTRAEYAAARRKEFADALQIGGGAPGSIELGVADQEATIEAARVASELAEVFARIRPLFVLTHPYEGGHPDHDATALAVHVAAGGVPILEFTSYHDAQGAIRTGEFLPGAAPVLTLTLDERQRRAKRAMLDCFRTQAATVAAFGVEAERFRMAPRYDFTRPPHEGLLYYERFDWGMSGERFRTLAARLGVRC
jgi:LmbE family N-acetylglucosaminyl deacetylase